MPKMSNIELLYQVKQPILSIKATVTLDELPMTIGSSFGKLGGYLAELGELMTDIPFVIYHNFENMDSRKIEVEIGFPVTHELPEKDNIKFSVIPESKIIFCMYRGAYGEITPVYTEMGQWLQKNGYKAKGPCYEYYYNDNTFPESELLTKVVIPFE